MTCWNAEGDIICKNEEAKGTVANRNQQLEAQTVKKMNIIAL